MKTGLRLNWKLLLDLGVAVGLTALVFFSVRQFEFLNYDDPYMVTANSILFRDFSRDLLLAPIAGLYHPLTTLSLWMDLHVFGGSAEAFHTTNLILHLLSVAALFAWTWRRSRKILVTFIVTAAFAWHPTHVESVAWISERKDVLSALFFWICLWGYDIAVRDGRRSGWVLCVTAAILSLLAKPFALTLPVLLPFLEWADGGFQEKPLALLRKRALPIAFFAVIAIAAGAFAVFSQTQISGASPAASAGAFARLPLQILFYVGKTLWPWPLKIFYGDADLVTVPIIASALIYFAILAALWRRSKRDVIWGLGFFALTILPMLKIVTFGDVSPVSDRYLYVAQTGLIWPLTVAIARFGSTKPRLAAAWICAGLLGGGWILMTKLRLPAWRDSQSLWQAQLEADPNSKLAHDNLARELASHGRNLEALAHFEHGNSDTSENWVNRIQILLRLGRTKDARALIGPAEAKFPGQIDLLIASGDLAVQEGDFAKARSELERALALPAPETVSTAKVRALTSLGLLAIREGKFKECLDYEDRALNLLPTFRNALYNRALCLLNLNRFDEALAAYDKVIALAPDFAQAYNDRGVVYAKRGDPAKARANFERALALDPNFTSARLNLERLR